MSSGGSPDRRLSRAGEEGDAEMEQEHQQQQQEAQEDEDQHMHEEGAPSSEPRTAPVSEAGGEESAQGNQSQSQSQTQRNNATPSDLRMPLGTGSSQGRRGRRLDVALRQRLNRNAYSVRSTGRAERRRQQQVNRNIHDPSNLISPEQLADQIHRFVTTYAPVPEEDPSPEFPRLVQRRILTDSQTVEVDCSWLYKFNPSLYSNVIKQAPAATGFFEEEFQHLVVRDFAERGEQWNNAKLSPQFMNLKECKKMRDLDPEDIDQLVAITGIVIRSSEPLPDITYATFRCANQDNRERRACNHPVGTYPNSRGEVDEPTRCDKCNGDHTFRLSHNECFFRDKQVLKIQETPESIPEGETPQTVLIYCFGDLFDSAKPGDRVEVTGFYRATGVRVIPRMRNLKSNFRTFVEACHIKRLAGSGNRGGGWGGVGNDGLMIGGEEGDAAEVPEHVVETVQDIHNRANDSARTGGDGIYEWLTKSFAPSIFENEDTKKGLLCMLFGGTAKTEKNGDDGTETGRRLRGELNVLMCGDPSTAKSQLLQFVHGLAPRGVYTSGKGSSAVGLTAYVTRDPDTQDLTLESGALVLSDRGVCCIDEFDKMDDNTRSILHEVMEQQTVSVAKAGIVCTLNARAAVVASANPVGSRYDRKKSIVENINLPAALLSRFDLIYLMLDESDREHDVRLATHLTAMYTQGGVRGRHQVQPPLSPKELQWYVAYSRLVCQPALSQEAAGELVEEYVALRRSNENRKMVSATPRQLESLIRLSEALARMEWTSEVQPRHVREAVRLMKVSLYRTAVDPETGEVDFDMFATGRSSAQLARQNAVCAAIRQVLLSEASREMARTSLLQAVNDRMREGRQAPLEIRNTFNEFEEALMRLREEGEMTTVRGARVRLLVGGGGDDLI